MRKIRLGHGGLNLVWFYLCSGVLKIDLPEPKFDAQLHPRDINLLIYLHLKENFWLIGTLLLVLCRNLYEVSQTQEKLDVLFCHQFQWKQCLHIRPLKVLTPSWSTTPPVLFTYFFEYLFFSLQVFNIQPNSIQNSLENAQAFQDLYAQEPPTPRPTLINKYIHVENELTM